MATRKQPASEEVVETSGAVEEVVGGDAGLEVSSVAGDGAGETLPAASQEERESLAPPATTPPEIPPADDVQAVTARVLCAVTIGVTRYQPNDVIEGLPADVLAQHAGSLDADEAAIAHALADGGAVIRFEG